MSFHSPEYRNQFPGFDPRATTRRMNRRRAVKDLSKGAAGLFVFLAFGGLLYVSNKDNKDISDDLFSGTIYLSYRDGMFVHTPDHIELIQVQVTPLAGKDDKNQGNAILRRGRPVAIDYPQDKSNEVGLNPTDPLRKRTVYSVVRVLGQEFSGPPNIGSISVTINGQEATGGEWLLFVGYDSGNVVYWNPVENRPLKAGEKPYFTSANFAQKATPSEIESPQK